MSALPDSVLATLVDAVLRRAPRELLLTHGDDGQANRQLAEALPDDIAIREYTCEPASPDAAPARRADLALVVQTLETASAAQGRQWLSALRDVHAHGVFALINNEAPGASAWTVAEFIALGFRKSQANRELPHGWSLYRYDIYDYKTTPSWLNSRYWANPERWNKARW